MIEPSSKFPLGTLVATIRATSSLTPEEIANALHRHSCGDWGDLCADDRAANDFAVTGDLRILSVYTSSSGRIFWIITECDRSFTTVLLPQDY